MFFGSGVDSIQVFSTNLTSKENRTLSLAFGGDDGTSLFVDRQFVGGGGFGATTRFDLNLVAAVPTRIDFVGYNGPVNWQFSISAADGRLLNDIPGVALNSAPEPSIIFLAVMSLAVMIIGCLGRRCLSRCKSSSPADLFREAVPWVTQGQRAVCNE
jgi:hypothetical protein